MTRLAAIHREIAELQARLAELHSELAEALTSREYEPANDAKKQQVKRATPLLVRSDVEISDVDRARAAAALRRLGHRVK